MLPVNRSGKGIPGQLWPILFSNHGSHLDCGIIGRGLGRPSLTDCRRRRGGDLVLHVQHSFHSTDNGVSLSPGESSKITPIIVKSWGRGDEGGTPTKQNACLNARNSNRALN